MSLVESEGELFFSCSLHTIHCVVFFFIIVIIIVMLGCIAELFRFRWINGFMVVVKRSLLVSVVVAMSQTFVVAVVMSLVESGSEFFF